MTVATFSSLAPDLLRRRTDPAALGFSSTADLPPLPYALGQSRAEEALAFGLAMPHPGYHVFIMGEPGEGRRAVALRCIQEKARLGNVPPDLCYLHNFSDPRSPRLMRLPSGLGARLKADLRDFCRELPLAIRAALNAENHVYRIETLENQYRTHEKDALSELEKSCAEDGLCLINTPDGFVVAPKENGAPITPDAFEALSEEARQNWEKRAARWNDALAELLAELPAQRQELAYAVARAEQRALRPVLEHLTRDLRRRYADFTEVIALIDAICEDITRRISVSGLTLEGEREGECGGAGGEEDRADSVKNALRQYQINLLVDHGKTQGAPIVMEDNPGFGNLFGVVESMPLPQNQTLSFDMIRAGALHRANGGYLVIDAQQLLAQSYVWEGLKRVLKSGRIVMDPPAEAQSWMSQASLNPEAAPCQVKVVLIGERGLYEMLAENDPDFRKLFKVVADFADDLPRIPENERLFARLIAHLDIEHGRDFCCVSEYSPLSAPRLLPADAPAVARLIEEAARYADHAGRLSLNTRYLRDVLREADFYARSARENAALITEADISAALLARARRCERYPREILEDILEGSTLISTEGERIGQANALVVVEVAGERHGHAARVTATVRVGDGDVVDIERETDLGGAIHSKGVLILTAFLAARYARHQPLSLSASLVFEQSYGEVEGDSASLAELCALLSALAQTPIRQSLALTGSINQFGEVQVIGGVNEKIEGFYDLCAARGLTGEQGVLIPAASVPHLMLRLDVVEAARAGRFHIYPVATVDETLERLTGISAGVPDAQGQLPSGSLNARIAAALADMTAALHPPRERERPFIRRLLRRSRMLSQDDE
ncbi:MAG: AAA family ATPase [Zoogloeaceae bacterium]|jgi:predicted ATP-dependent protease|nr:AAA family ATPase [Zoogloeaceae bacterium]